MSVPRRAYRPCLGLHPVQNRCHISTTVAVVGCVPHSPQYAILHGLVPSMTNWCALAISSLYCFLSSTSPRYPRRHSLSHRTQRPARDHFRSDQKRSRVGTPICSQLPVSRLQGLLWEKLSVMQKIPDSIT